MLIDLDDWFQNAATYGSYDTYDTQVQQIAEEVAIYNQDESDLVVAARELRAATEKFDKLYIREHKKWMEKNS
jgi:hypothetical protein